MIRALKPLRITAAVLLCLHNNTAWAQTQPSGIQVVVLTGEGDINSVGSRSAHDPIVRIEDRDGKPVPGASVVFTLPADGASGLFPNGDKTLIVSTDEKGQASASGLRVNQIAGRLQIHVNASWRGQTARTNITQFNMAVPGRRAGGGSGKVVAVVLAIAGAAAAGGAVALSKSKNPASSPAAVAAPPPIGITAGSGTVGPPR